MPRTVPCSQFGMLYCTVTWSPNSYAAIDYAVSFSLAYTMLHMHPFHDF